MKSHTKIFLFTILYCKSLIPYFCSICNKYLTLGSTNDSKKIKKNNGELWIKIRDLMRSITKINQ